MIVDVDTHWEAVSYRSEWHPLCPWLDELPSGIDMLAFGVAGDLLRALPDDERPTAAASIGQVHHALLPNGERVAVKVQRPNAPRQIESDIALLYQAARLAKERVRALDFIDAEQVVDEFARSIRGELDYHALQTRRPADG